MVRLAVVGAGVMGANHARVALRTPGVSVACVADPDPKKGEALARMLGAAYYPHYEDVAEVDAAIVASPTETHCEVALALLGKGLDLLIEKPIARSSEDAELIVRLAEEQTRVLQVGHVERFNAAVLALERLRGDIIHLECIRNSPYTPRTTAGVITDLMIHDLDLALALCGPVAEVRSQVVKVRDDSAGEDIGTALLRFESGATATLTANRLAQEKVRTVRVTQTDSEITLDLVRQDVAIRRTTHSEFVDQDGARYRQSGIIEVPYLDQRGEPLSLQLSEFVGAISTRQQPRVDGQQGLMALRLAEEVLDAGQFTSAR